MVQQNRQTGAFEEIKVNNVETPIARRPDLGQFHSINGDDDIFEIHVDTRFKPSKKKVDDKKEKLLKEKEVEDEDDGVPIVQIYPEIESPCNRVSRVCGAYMPLGNTSLPFYPHGSNTLSHGSVCSHLCGTVLLVMFFFLMVPCLGELGEVKAESTMAHIVPFQPLSEVIKKSTLLPFLNMSFDGTRSRLIILDDGHSLTGGAEAFCKQFNSINSI